jgi:hypothetical protein
MQEWSGDVSATFCRRNNEAVANRRSPSNTTFACIAGGGIAYSGSMDRCLCAPALSAPPSPAAVSRPFGSYIQYFSSNRFSASAIASSDMVLPPKLYDLFLPRCPRFLEGHQEVVVIADLRSSNQ